MGCGARIADMFSKADSNVHRHGAMAEFMRVNDLFFPGWDLFYIYHPEILDRASEWRWSFAARMTDQYG